MLRYSVNPRLKELGFRRTGRTYRLGAKDENQSTITIQAGSSASRTERTFYVWVSVIPRAYVAFRTRFDPSGTPDDPAIRFALVSERLDAPREVCQVRVDYFGQEQVMADRWCFGTEQQAARCGSLLVEAVVDLLPILETLRSPEALVEHYDLPSEMVGPLPKKGPMASTTRAIILSDLGRTPLLETLLRDVRAGGYDEVADWVEARSGP